MKTYSPNITYTGFEYSPDSITKYIEASGLFSILLKTGKIVHFSPENVKNFRNWLNSHGITDLRKET